jgi:hypothetical protein
MKMIIQATKKLRDKLKLEKLKQEERPPLFSWHANIIQIDYMNLVVLVNDSSAYMVVLTGVEEDEWYDYCDQRYREIAIEWCKENKENGVQLMKPMTKLDELLKDLDDEKYIFKLSIPSQADFYKEIIEHPNVVRVVALSGGYSQRCCR